VTREVVEEVLPLALVDPVRRSLAEPGLEQVAEIAPIARDRGWGVGLWLAAAPTLDAPVLDPIHPLVGKRREGAALRRALLDGWAGLLARG
jgi:hypothetical protein